MSRAFVVEKINMLVSTGGDLLEGWTRVYAEEDVFALSPGQAAQIRDLLRCIAWIRDLQLTGDPYTFDNGELFRDINRAYLADQLLTATKLYSQLDEYCKANQIPVPQWKMT